MQLQSDNIAINTNSFLLGAVTSLVVSHLTPKVYSYMKNRIRTIHLHNKLTRTRHYMSSKWNYMSDYIQSRFRPQAPIFQYEPQKTYENYESLKSFRERFGFSFDPVNTCTCNPCTCNPCTCDCDELNVSHLPMQPNNDSDETLKKKAE